MAENYTICADEAQAFQYALQSGSTEAIEAAEAELNNDAEDEDSEPAPVFDASEAVQ